MPARGFGAQEVPVDVLREMVRHPKDFDKRVADYIEKRKEAEAAEQKAREAGKATAMARDELSAAIEANNAAVKTHEEKVRKDGELSMAALARLRAAQRERVENTLRLDAREADIKSGEAACKELSAALDVKTAELDDRKASLDRRKENLDANWENLGKKSAEFEADTRMIAEVLERRKSPP